MRYSIILEPFKPEDWHFGSDNGLNKQSNKTLWFDYLPSFEKQRFEHFDAMDCVTRSALNCLETEFNYKILHKVFSEENIKWLYEKGYIDHDGKVNFNDSFNAALSGTTQYGNSLAKVGASIRYDGLIPEKLYQSGAGLTREQYLKTPPSHLKELGKEFLKRFKINHETVQSKDFIKALEFGTVQVVVWAWTSKDGIYYNKKGRSNHAVCLFDFEQYHSIFDSYMPHIKNLTPTYRFYGYGYQYTATEKESLIIKIKNMLEKIIRDVKGGFHFIKNGKRQKIEHWESAFGALIDEFGCRTLNTDELSQIPTTTAFFSKKPHMNWLKEIFGL